MAVKLNDLYTSQLIRTRNGVKRQYNDPTFKGMMIQPARTNYLLNSETPATQTTGSLGTGTYTLWMNGTGSVSVAANTAAITGAGTATEGSPVTFTVDTAGTVDVTVTDVVDYFQLENGAFPTPRIPTTDTSVTRPASVASFNSAGRIREQNCCVWLKRIFTAGGQTGWVLNSYTDASNETGVLVEPTQITLRKRIGGVNYDAVTTFTHSAVATDIQIILTDKGLAVRCSDDNGATWTAWSEDADTQAAVIASTFSYDRDGAEQVACTAPWTATAYLPAQSTLAGYEDWAATNTEWNKVGA